MECLNVITVTLYCLEFVRMDLCYVSNRHVFPNVSAYFTRQHQTFCYVAWPMLVKGHPQEDISIYTSVSRWILAFCFFFIYCLVLPHKFDWLITGLMQTGSDKIVPIHFRQRHQSWLYHDAKQW